MRRYRLGGMGLMLLLVWFGFLFYDARPSNAVPQSIAKPSVGGITLLTIEEAQTSIA